MMRAILDVVVDLNAPAGVAELEAWAWAVEKQLEEMALVAKAEVVSIVEAPERVAT